MEDVRHRREFRMTTRQAAEYFGVSSATLIKMEKGGDLAPQRTPRGHRRYSLRILEEYVQSKRRPVPRPKADESN